MKRVILSMAILAMVTLSAKAQKESSGMVGLKFSIGLEGALPTGDLKTSSNFGIGGSAQVEYKAAESFGLTGNVGYLTFSGKTIDVGSGVNYKVPSLNLIPVLVGGKYYFTPNGVYGMVQIGLSFLSGGGSSSSAFTYSPGVGVYVTPNFDLLLKYQAASKSGETLSFLGLRAAYSF